MRTHGTRCQASRSTRPSSYAHIINTPSSTYHTKVARHTVALRSGRMTRAGGAGRRSVSATYRHVRTQAAWTATTRTMAMTTMTGTTRARKKAAEGVGAILAAARARAALRRRRPLGRARSTADVVYRPSQWRLATRPYRSRSGLRLWMRMVRSSGIRGNRLHLPNSPPSRRRSATWLRVRLWPRPACCRRLPCYRLRQSTTSVTRWDKSRLVSASLSSRRCHSHLPRRQLGCDPLKCLVRPARTRHPSP